MIAGLRPSVRFPRRMVPNWVSEPIGFPKPELECFEPGDECRRHRAHAGYQNTQFALGGRNLDVVFIGQIVLL